MKTIKIIAAALAAMTMVMSCKSQGDADLQKMLKKIRFLWWVKQK